MARAWEHRSPAAEAAQRAATDAQRAAQSARKARAAADAAVDAQARAEEARITANETVIAAEAMAAQPDRPSVDDLTELITAVNPSGRVTPANAEPPTVRELVKTILPSISRR
jgi:hypothetical protein